MTKSKYKAKCSRCERKFTADSRGELLDKLRKHLWKDHATWMRNRIKRGLKKRREKLANPIAFKTALGHIFPPARAGEMVETYKNMSPKEREFAKNAVRLLTVPVGAEASAIGEAFIRLLDKYVEG